MAWPAANNGDYRLLSWSFQDGKTLLFAEQLPGDPDGSTFLPTWLVVAAFKNLWCMPVVSGPCS